MLPCYEPLATDTLLLGMEWLRQSGGWPVLRHVFECDREAGLIVDVDGLGETQVYAVSYTFQAGDVREDLVPL